MTGPFETAIRAAIPAGTTLETHARRAKFELANYDGKGLVLLLGAKRNRTPLPWECVEGIRGFLEHRDWVAAGGRNSVEGEPGTLDGFVKQWQSTNVARWLVRVLEVAGLVEVDRGPPLRLRLPVSSKVAT